ncbi:MAG TPA: branched chain amino acid ABC transporter substrate-binding protein [Micromonosporaceae bacterium]|nr:branched chain amino acid ABC transporter substrate-binding protein [Micromonosporaceae bacterium]
MRQRFTRVLGGVALFALVAAGAAACKQEETPAAKACDLKLGFFGALTGADAGLVTPIKQGADLAVAQYNEKNPNCKVSVVPFDSQGAPTNASGLAKSAIADTKIVGMIGPSFSGESEVANPIFEEAGLPAITPSATRPSLSNPGYKIFHRGVGNDDAQGPAIARYIKQVVKSTKVYVADDQSAYGAGLADKVKAGLGADVIKSSKVADNQQDFSAVVSDVKTSGADVLFYGGYTEEAAPFLKQLRAGGYTGKFIGGDGINDANMISVSGATTAEGVQASCPCAPATAAKGTFVADFKKANGADPGVYADVAFDVANIFLEAIAGGKNTRADILSFISSYNKAGSASGVTYKWDAKGELAPDQVKIYIFTVKGGAWVAEAEAPRA